MNVKELERSIITTYRKEIFRPFTKAVDDYKLVCEGDVICVCISGGKDSFMLAKLMQELALHGKYKITCKYLFSDPGYNKDYLKEVKSNAKKLGIKLEVVESHIFEAVSHDTRKTPCYVCAKMRRGFLYDTAKKMGCNKIALGHHYDDAIETTMLSLLYNGRYNTMMPKLHSKNFEGMELIRPLYLIREKDIIRFMNRWNIKYTSCACPLKKENSSRAKVKEIIEYLKKDNEYVDKNIFASADNVELDNIRCYLEKGKYTNFLDNFDK